MPTRLVALTEGPDILVNRAPVMIGRHPRCDARLGSSRVSRRHCCLAEAAGVVMVRDLGSTNGIRINGRRVGSGRLRPGDELSIAHVRYRLERTPEDRMDPAASPREPVATHPENRAAR
jgi:pSer/pThr/pTyr-binding forkhead associated (FHA) protein